MWIGFIDLANGWWNFSNYNAIVKTFEMKFWRMSQSLSNLWWHLFEWQPWSIFAVLIFISIIIIISFNLCSLWLLLQTSNTKNEPLFDMYGCLHSCVIYALMWPLSQTLKDGCLIVVIIKKKNVLLSCWNIFRVLLF